MATKSAVTSAATTNRVLEALEHGLRNGKLALTEEVTMDVLAECLRSQKRPDRPREGGRAVPSSRASLYRYFRNPIEALLKLERYIVVHDRAVPESLTQYLATHSPQADRHHVYGVPLHRVDEAVLESSLHRARKDKDWTGVAFWSRTIAEKILARATEDDPEAVRRALMISSEGYSEVLDANASGAQTYRELMWCARAAAYACVLLSRGDVGDPSYLAQVTFWKNAEGQMAGALGSTVGQAMAEFHAKRANALSGGMVEQEVRELRHVVDVLLENYVDNTEYDAFDLIKFHDLTFIITRLYVTDWAYRSERGNEELVERFFPEGVDELIAKLRRIYDSGDRMAAAEDEKVAALIRLRATYECISRHLGNSAGRGLRHPLDTDLIEGIKNVDVTDFLRVEDAKIVQAIVFARYVLACIHLDTPMFELDQTRMILTALDFCQAGIRVTRDAGTGKTMRDVAQRVQRELLASLEGADVEQLRQSRREQWRDEDRRNRFRKTRHQINTLVMTAITASPMTGVEAKHVANTADAVSAYLNSTMLRRGDDR